MVDRREFLKRAGLLAVAAPLSGCAQTPPVRSAASPAVADASGPAALVPSDWQRLREEFSLDFSYSHFAGFLLACHPRIVLEDIEHHRRALQQNPVLCLLNTEEREEDVRAAAGAYLQVEKAQVALTGSTTMGLGLVYNGLALRPGQEVLTSIHDHYATKEALSFRAAKDGVKINTIRLFDNPQTMTVDEVLHNVESNIRDATRVAAFTWVHSGSGVKLPIGQIGQLIERVNQSRAEADHIIFVVDGVHGLGVENTTFAELHCDFFVAGTHKWLFGPRGTGIICSRTPHMRHLTPTVASFSSYDNFGTTMTPGGFHAFEHQWAVRRAFEFHASLGKAAVTERIHQLNSYLKTRLRETRGVELVTPVSTELSAGFTFFRVGQIDPGIVSELMLEQRVITSEADRDVGPVVRMAPGLLNNEAEIDHAVALVAEAYKRFG
ncbi:MAG: aminotransferase class V-fold PLP-dependent enzyme [Polyangiales bacterium]